MDQGWFDMGGADPSNDPKALGHLEPHPDGTEANGLPLPRCFVGDPIREVGLGPAPRVVSVSCLITETSEDTMGPYHTGCHASGCSAALGLERLIPTLVALERRVAAAPAVPAVWASLASPPAAARRSKRKGKAPAKGRKREDWQRRSRAKGVRMSSLRNERRR